VVSNATRRWRGKAMIYSRQRKSMALIARDAYAGARGDGSTAEGHKGARVRTTYFNYRDDSARTMAGRLNDGIRGFVGRDTGVWVLSRTPSFQLREKTQNNASSEIP